jgi:hypothetical protein
MCDHHGSQAFSGLAQSALSRRTFLKSSALGTIVMALPGGMMGSAHAASTIKGTHGNGFCNVAFFITHARQLAKEDGLTLEFVNTPSFADQVTFIGSGQVDVSVMPYTNFMALYDAGAPVKIVAGGGVQGARDLPERYAGGASLRLVEEERGLLQGRNRSLHGLHGRHGRWVQVRLDRHCFGYRAIWFIASQRRQGLRAFDRRDRHLRAGLYGLHPRRQHEPH